MPDVVSIHAARTQLSRLVDRAYAGEEIILAKAGKPHARLVPLAPARTRELGDDFAEEAMRPLSAEELADWE